MHEPTAESGEHSDSKTDRSASSDSALIKEHGLLESGGHPTPTHGQALPVHGSSGTEPIADKGPRPRTAHVERSAGRSGSYQEVDSA